MKFTDFIIESEINDLKNDLKKLDTYLKAPNGKKSNLTEYQWVTVRTKAFKKWFGDWENDKINASKVLDDNGEPLVVYHGTTAKFSKFEPTKAGVVGENFGNLIFFTSSSKVASGYSLKLTNSKEFNDARSATEKAWAEVSKAVINHGISSNEFKQAKENWSNIDNKRLDIYNAINNFEIITDGSNVISAFLSIKNPLIADGKGKNWREVHAEIFEKYHTSNHDGVIIKNVNDSATTTTSETSTIYAFPKPNQVKSAIGNKGSFDKESDLMHESFN